MRAEELELPIGDLPLREPVCVPPDTPVRDAVKTLQQARIGCVLVTDDAGLILGIFTERDVLRRLASLGTRGGDLPISEVMTARPKALHAEDSIVYALHEMHIGGYRHIPLTDGAGRPVKTASVRHMVDYLAERLMTRNADEGGS